MGPVTHIVRNSDLQTDTLIRLNYLGSMIAILECGICGEGISVPTWETVRQYLFHLGQEVDLIRQNLEKIFFREIAPGEESPAGEEGGCIFSH